MGNLTQVTEDIWVVTSPHKMMGLHLGTRMSVVRLSGGGLLLHSPVPLSDSLRRELDNLGPVRHVVCPNLFHHSYAGAVMQAYPEAILHAPEGLAKKRKDLKIHQTLSETPHPDWAEDLVPLTIEGSMLNETVFLHKKSRTIISADLAENFETSDHLLTRLYLKAAGIHGRVGWSRLLRFVYRDRAKARASIDRLLSWDFERVIIAHGNLIEEKAKDAIRETFSWLK